MAHKRTKGVLFMSHLKKYIAEMIGTCVLVTFGCGTACAVGCSSESGSGYLLTALAFGLAIVAMAYSVGNISGCHVNPAVSLAMLIRKQLSLADFCGYVVAQCVGSFFGCVIIGFIFGFDTGFGANQIQSVWENGSVGGAFLVELVLTFVFVFTIIGVTSKPEFSSVSGIVIGLTLTFVHILGIHFTGTSVNPARSLFPAIFAGGDALSQLWIFILAPLVGAAIAALLYIVLDNAKESKETDEQKPTAKATTAKATKAKAAHAKK